MDDEGKKKRISYDAIVDTGASNATCAFELARTFKLAKRSVRRAQQLGAAVSKHLQRLRFRQIEQTWAEAQESAQCFADVAVFALETAALWLHTTWMVTAPSPTSG